jgi:hypothetical protein
VLSGIGVLNGPGTIGQNAGIGRLFGAPASGQPLQGQPSLPAAPNLGPTQEQVFGLLKDSLTRRFKIDIENDSTIAGDESQEKQDRTQFIESVTKFMEAWGPMVMQKPELAPLASELLKFGVRGFRVARELEESIDELGDKLTQPGAMQKGPDPKVQAEQIKLQGTQARTQSEIQKSQIDAQSEQQMAQAKMQQTLIEAEARVQEIKMKMAEAEQAHGHKAAQAQMAHGVAMDKMALEQQKQQTAQMPKWPTDPAKEQGF